MTETINGDLILKEDTVIEENLIVNGDIRCEGGRWNLTVRGDIAALDIAAWNIAAWDIVALDIDAWNIAALDIVARDIVALDIDAWNIAAWDIAALDIVARNIAALDIVARNIDAQMVLCERLTLKEGGKCLASSLVENRSKLERKVLKVGR